MLSIHGRPGSLVLPPEIPCGEGVYRLIWRDNASCYRWHPTKDTTS
jgi:hypothetical protein